MDEEQLISHLNALSDAAGHAQTQIGDMADGITANAQQIRTLQEQTASRLALMSTRIDELKALLIRLKRSQ